MVIPTHLIKAEKYIIPSPFILSRLPQFSPLPKLPVNRNPFKSPEKLPINHLNHRINTRITVAHRKNQTKSPSITEKIKQIHRR